MMGRHESGDASSRRTIATLTGHGGNVYRPSLSADGKLIITAGSDGTARVWETSSGRAVAVLDGYTDSVNSARFSSDGN